MAIFCNSGIYPLFDHIPEVVYKIEDLYKARQWDIQTEQWMTLRRTVLRSQFFLFSSTLPKYPANGK